MVDIPEQAVKAALDAYCDCDSDGELDPMRAALTAAAPYMQGVKVCPMETAPSGESAEKPSVIEIHEGAWAVVKGTNGKDAGWVDTHELFAHQLYRHRILSTLESSPREQALEEAAQALEKWGDIYGDNAAAAIRALSSPDHVEAGKVEGDGWLPIESAPKDGTDFIGWDGKWAFRCSAGKKYVLYPHQEGGPKYEDVWDGHYYDSLTIEHPTHWRPLPSAPASEGAE